MTRKQPKASHGYCQKYQCDLKVFRYMNNRLSESMKAEVNPRTLHIYGCPNEYKWHDGKMDFTGIKQGAIGTIGVKP